MFKSIAKQLYYVSVPEHGLQAWDDRNISELVPGPVLLVTPRLPAQRTRGELFEFPSEANAGIRAAVV